MFHIDAEWYMWGAGTYGKRLISFMKDEITFKAVIDSNSEKQGGTFEGVPIIGWEEAKREFPKTKIVIAQVYPNVLRDFLLSLGYEEYEDFVTIYDFIPRWFKQKNDTLVLKVVNFSPATCCTLSCDHCQSFIPYQKNRTIFSGDELVDNADLLFANLDRIFLINMCLGESFLNKNLARLSRHLFENYRARYGFFVIVTNGTIVPPDSDFQAFAEYDVILSISDYSEDNKKLKDRFNELLQKCEAFGVKYYLNTSSDISVWFDFGNPNEYLKDISDAHLKQRYQRCFKCGSSVRGGILYSCAAQNAAIAVAGVPGPEDGDYYDLRQPLTSSSREELYKIISRNPDKGYISHCARCNGTTPINKDEIL